MTDTDAPKPAPTAPIAAVPESALGTSTTTKEIEDDQDFAMERSCGA
jgi:hypothetical protein